jgi:hypothetical protein
MMLDHQRIMLDDVEGQYKFAEASGFDFVCVLQHIYLKLSPWKLQLCQALRISCPRRKFQALTTLQ